MSRKARPGAPPSAGRSRWSINRVLGLLLQISALIFLAVAGAGFASEAEQFLVTDRRFRLHHSAAPNKQQAGFRVQGAFYTPEERIAEVFERDFGRSLYLLPLAERRRQLLALPWVKEAAVRRTWPGQLAVDVTERVPVAFLPPGLVDDQGVFLQAERPVKLRLPVLAGIEPDASEEVRRERVRLFLRVREDLGPLMNDISEMDVEDEQNVRVTQQFGPRAPVLLLGSRNFRQRLTRFLENRTEILSRLPDARALDLRLRDRITGVASAVPEGRHAN